MTSRNTAQINKLQQRELNSKKTVMVMCKASLLEATFSELAITRWRESQREENARPLQHVALIR